MRRAIIVLCATLVALAAWRAAPVRAEAYTTTVTSNITTTIGCLWDYHGNCETRCTDCTAAICTAIGAYSAVGACVGVTGATEWSVTGSPSPIYTETRDLTLVSFWNGNTTTGVQSVAYTVEDAVGIHSGGFAVDDEPLDWSFPTTPLLPYLFGLPEDGPSFRVTPAMLWDVARTALTSYTIVSGGSGATWLLFAAILLLPIAGMIIYRLLTAPPEI